MINLGRNEPCHCGSGKKYKKCCLEKDREKQRNVRVATSVEVITNKRTVSVPAAHSVVADHSKSQPAKLSLAELTWEHNMHRELAESAIPAIADEYKLTAEQTDELVELWNGYSQSEAPRYRKPGGFAGALEYLVAAKQGGSVSQNELAAKHDVSATTLSKCIGQLSEYAEKGSLAKLTV
ncbi:SEC-C metal-binding domain-containing protein [Neobacillus mesonae]|nr:SEC-C metal-binding domain-containing protein [Neobacillus mesonae]